MRRHLFTPLALSSFAFTVCLLTPGISRAAEPLEVVRVGDRQMSCTALAGEINSLAQPQGEEAAKPKKKRGFGFLKVLGSAVPMVGMAGGLGGALVSSAAGAAQTAAAQSQVDSQMDEARRMTGDALAGPGIAEQRKERLTAIFEEKKC